MSERQAIDLTEGITEGIPCDAWSEIDAHRAVDALVARADPELLPEGAVTLRGLASAARPRMSGKLRLKLAVAAPEALRLLEADDEQYPD